MAEFQRLAKSRPTAGTIVAGRATTLDAGYQKQVGAYYQDPCS